MRNLFQGGECGPSGVEASSNQFKAMMDMMMMGNQNPEKVVDFTNNSGVNFQQELINRKMEFNKMKEIWAQEDHMLMSQGANMQEHFRVREYQHKQAVESIQQVERMKQQHLLNMQRTMINEQMRRRQMQHMMEMQRRSAEQDKMRMLQLEFQKTQIAQEKTKTQQSKVYQKNLGDEEEQARIKDATSSMLNVMMEDEDPRFKNSQFLNFLKRVNKGDLVIKGQEITQLKPDTESKWSPEDNLVQAKPMTEAESNRLKDIAQKLKQPGNDFETMYEMEWQRRLKQYEEEYQNTAQFEKTLEQRYQDVLKEMDLDLSEAWQGATDLEQQLVYGDFRDKYIWSTNNPYQDVAMPLPIAMDFINKGRNNEAILALEAHLQKNESDSERWRMLGHILQQNDQDQKSVPCFVNALKGDPHNLDSLLSLGVSCTNILDEVKAMNYLKHWIINNPKYQVLKPNVHIQLSKPNIIPDEITNQITYKVEEIKAMNSRMIDLFEAAMRVEPNDPELMTSLAVLYFIKREYEISVGLFERALKLDPSNYSLWNKMGASLAHLGRPDEAINCYHKALDIKPNYVRVWVNLGIAHGYKGLYEEAARFYLNALSFRPDAKHIWAYLQTTFMSMQRYDLIKLIGRQDPSLFQQFDVMKVEDLPTPEIDYRVTAEQHIIGKSGATLTTEDIK